MWLVISDKVWTHKYILTLLISFKAVVARLRPHILFMRYWSPCRHRTGSQGPTRIILLVQEAPEGHTKF